MPEAVPFDIPVALRAVGMNENPHFVLNIATRNVGAGRQTGPRNEIEAVDSAVVAYRLGQAEAARGRTNQLGSSGVRWNLIVPLLIVGAILGAIWLINSGWFEGRIDWSSLFQAKSGCDAKQERFLGENKDGVPVYILEPDC